MLKRIVSVLCVIAVFIGAFAFLTRLLSPKYATDLIEGGMIGQYYDQAGDHDVIFIGDCEVYANYSPMKLYRQYGVTAYIRGTPQQLVWQSYYVLEETLRYETPKAVVFNVNSMRYGEPVSEAYNRLTIDGMRWSASKVGIIRASMTEEESFLSYVFPILRYHSRFDELTQEDWTYLFSTPDNTYNGFLMNQNVVPAGTLPTVRVLADYSLPEICWSYLEKMRALCEDNGVELILVKAPSLYPHWYEEYDQQIKDYANGHGLCYYNFAAVADEIGIDYETDTYDGGLHLNLNGAVKLSAYFGDLLTREHQIPDRRQDEALAAEYEEKLRRYDEAVQAGKDE